ncbi:MAG TPA: ABC transporter ATP-binding protein [Candidatus Methylomirabilis sp.]|nr:ABC transporter ATP-binding protein [Candidatus Methylomirabilis sp.]
MLEVEGIDVAYADLPALRSVSLRVTEGEIVALVGSNGAGKTTTLRAISGLIRPRVGTIRFEGKRVDRLPPHEIAKRGIGHVPEGRRLFPMMTVWENLLIGSCTPEAKQRFNETIAFIFSLFPRLKDRRNQLAGTLSGGEQQMVAIGRALAMSPRLLMMDEPSLGLAPNLAQEIFDTIRQLNTRGVTALLVEQNVKQALRLAHRAYVLENGELILHGNAPELADNPHVRKAYLGI